MPVFALEMFKKKKNLKLYLHFKKFSFSQKATFHVVLLLIMSNFSRWQALLIG